MLLDVATSTAEEEEPNADHAAAVEDATSAMAALADRVGTLAAVIETQLTAIRDEHTIERERLRAEVGRLRAAVTDSQSELGRVKADSALARARGIADTSDSALGRDVTELVAEAADYVAGEERALERRYVAELERRIAAAQPDPASTPEAMVGGCIRALLQSLQQQVSSASKNTAVKDPTSRVPEVPKPTTAVKPFNAGSENVAPRPSATAAGSSEAAAATRSRLAALKW
jgi:hypothetical protein